MEAPGEGESWTATATAYPPLNVGSGGTASAQAHVPVELNEARRYIVNVHASSTDLGTNIACGPLDG